MAGVVQTGWFAYIDGSTRGLKAGPGGGREGGSGMC